MDSNTIPVACFAQPLTDETLANYAALVAGLPASETKDAMQDCLACVSAWWALPESTRTDGSRLQIMHGGKSVEYSIVPLEKEHIEQLWNVTPWDRELNTLSNATDTGLFDLLTDKTLRDAAFHLLWHTKEITRDREPLTIDKL